jgi:hypothetical protein
MTVDAMSRQVMAMHLLIELATVVCWLAVCTASTPSLQCQGVLAFLCSSCCFVLCFVVCWGMLAVALFSIPHNMCAVDSVVFTAGSTTGHGEW